MPSTGDPLWISEQDVAELLDLGAALAAVERAFAGEARGTSLPMPKTHVKWGEGDTLHAIGAVDTDAGLAATKTWAHTRGGATPLLLLFDAAQGSLVAVVEAFALGQLRTAAVSGVATRHLSAPGADLLAIAGSGRQAMGQVAAVAAVRPLRAVRVFSPTAAHRERFARRVREELGVEAHAVDSMAAAAAGAPIVTTATRARTPFVSAAMLAPGAHINAIGAITPERAELAADVLARAALIVADSVAAAQRLSRELGDHCAAGGDWAAVAPLHQVVAGRVTRRADAGLTVLKAMGSGIADLGVGLEVLARARRERRGRAIPHPRPVEVDWRRGSHE